MSDFKRKRVGELPKDFGEMRETPGTVVEVKGAEIDQNTLDRLKDTLDSIAHKQEKGVVFVIGSGKDKVKDEDGKIAPSGALFTHKMNQLEAVLLMIESSGVDVSLLMMALLADKKLK